MNNTEEPFRFLKRFIVDGGRADVLGTCNHALPTSGTFSSIQDDLVFFNDILVF
jgi:hypothetical protein